MTGRLKELSSIHAKMQTQHVALDQIHDLVAFRIVLDAPTEAVHAVLGIVHATWTPVPGRLKDYVAPPEAERIPGAPHHGRSAPYGGPTEVQIRTAEMTATPNSALTRTGSTRKGRIDTTSEDESRFAWLPQLFPRVAARSRRSARVPSDTVKIDLFPTRFVSHAGAERL